MKIDEVLVTRKIVERYVQEFLDNAVLREAGGDEDRRHRVGAAQGVETRTAAHPRHPHVEDHEVDLAAPPCVEGQGLFPVGGRQDVVAEAVQDPLEGLPDKPFVVDDEDPARAVGHPGWG